MEKPQLISMNGKGGTIHSYQLPGGLTTFEKYLACNNGHCTFYDSLKLAVTGLQKMT